MARYHGRRGRLFLSTSGATAAVSVASLTNWSIDMDTDREEVTAFGDNNKVYVQGLKDISGSFAGFWDDTDSTIFTAQDSATAPKMYLYPDFTNAPTKYWYGTAWVSASVETEVGGAVKVSGSFAAASDWARF